LRADGYGAVGVDPKAPDGPEYRQTEFENYGGDGPVDAIVACASLHHVADLAQVLDLAKAALVPGGPVVVVEWAHERFDEPTARWCFDRLSPSSDDEHDWLRRHHDRWGESGRSWDEYFEAWVREEGMHPGRDVVAGLQARFDTRAIIEGPYCFADLYGVTAQQEQAAIDAGQIRATGIRYVGHRTARQA
jgi:SAM-dependent methyltransferase